MKQGINLSLARKSVDNFLKKILYAAVAVFAFTFILAIILIAYNLILSSSSDSLAKQEDQSLSQIKALQVKKDKLVETKSRLADIRKIIAKRSPVTTRIDTVTHVIPNDVEINAINGTNVDLQVTLESDDLASLNTLMEQKVAELANDRKRGIQKIEMRSFGLNPKTLKYTVTFGITFS